MTSTSITTGFGDDVKPSSKVLRPPGGGSSDIFGSETPATPRSIRNHMASNIFGSTQEANVKNSGDNIRRGQKNIDSHSRLFGESDRPFTPGKNHLKSNIPIGGEKGATTNGNGTAAPPTNGHAKNGKVENGNGNAAAEHQNGISKTELEINSNSVGCSDASPKDELNSVRSNIDRSDVQQNNNETEEHITKIKNYNNNNFDNDTQNINNISVNQTTISSSNINGHEDHNTNVHVNNGNDESSSSVTTSSTVSPVALSDGTNSSKNSLRSPRNESRNPVTGSGIDAPSYYRRALRREGNPVTGEGYNRSAGAVGTGAGEINTTVPSLNGANQVINKNRIPPGGFSSGLW